MQEAGILDAPTGALVRRKGSIRHSVFEAFGCFTFIERDRAYFESLGRGLAESRSISINDRLMLEPEPVLRQTVAAPMARRR